MTVLDTPITLGDRTQSVAEWIAERRLVASTVLSRRKRGCSWAEALAPVSKNGMKRRIEREMSDRGARA